ncbi:putative protein transport protein sec23-1 [Iris pallida]|uniref:Protein transport protein SEC23 n=1 Tax=Iris pallida TaxID=29817 RepID=A0AAX6FSX0_IRIPA|nr:putative protein transport protein sec23-1 [Iris pallida]
MEEEEIGEVRREMGRVLAQLPGHALVGLVSFREMVWVHDLGFTDCSRVLVFAGDREISLDRVIELMGIHHLPNSKFGMPQPQLVQKQGFILPVSMCEFGLTTALEELIASSNALAGAHPKRATGAVISTALALLEGCSPKYGGRVMVFTSGPAIIGPGLIIETDLSKPIRTHRDIASYQAPLSEKAKIFYKKLAQRFSDRSLVFDLFVCSLDQVGATELRYPIEASGGFMILAESFKSNEFKKCLRLIFKQERDEHLKMNFEASIKVVTTNEVKICGALGPCMSLRVKMDQ